MNSEDLENLIVLEGNQVKKLKDLSSKIKELSVQRRSVKTSLRRTQLQINKRLREQKSNLINLCKENSKVFAGLQHFIEIDLFCYERVPRE